MLLSLASPIGCNIVYFSLYTVCNEIANGHHKGGYFDDYNGRLIGLTRNFTFRSTGEVGLLSSGEIGTFKKVFWFIPIYNTTFC